jgi:hypothetical protein
MKHAKKKTENQHLSPLLSPHAEHVRQAVHARARRPFRQDRALGQAAGEVEPEGGERGGRGRHGRGEGLVGRGAAARPPGGAATTLRQDQAAVRGQDGGRRRQAQRVKVEEPALRDGPGLVIGEKGGGGGVRVVWGWMGMGERDCEYGKTKNLPTRACPGGGRPGRAGPTPCPGWRPGGRRPCLVFLS